MICIVHGFRSQVQGLQFEWAWQHPLQCRSVRKGVMEANIPGCKLTSRGKARDHRIQTNVRILASILSSAPWSMMPLTVTFFDEDVMKTFKPPAGVKIVLAADVASFAAEISDSAKSHESEDLKYSECAACETLFLGNESRVVRCPDCRSLFHARCAASSFQKPGAVSLMPSKEGTCPVCERTVEWSAFVRSAFVYQPKDSESSSDENASPKKLDSDKSEVDDVPATQPLRFHNARSPEVIPQGSSLRERLFKKTGDPTVFKI